MSHSSFLSLALILVPTQFFAAGPSVPLIRDGFAYRVPGSETSFVYLASVATLAAARHPHAKQAPTNIARISQDVRLTDAASAAAAGARPRSAPPGFEGYTPTPPPASPAAGASVLTVKIITPRSQTPQPTSKPDIQSTQQFPTLTIAAHMKFRNPLKMRHGR